jgi:hypothetical protein
VGAHRRDRQPGVPGAEHNIRQVLQLPVTRSQYQSGATSPELIAPDGWTLDQHFLDQPGRKDAQIALALDTGHFALEENLPEIAAAAQAAGGPARWLLPGRVRPRWC